MGFRNDEEARAHRVRALEKDLEERDRKIAVLEARLEGKQKPARKEKKDDTRGRGAKGVPKVADVPEGDRWTVPVHQPYRWLYGLGTIASMVAMGCYFHVAIGAAWSEIGPVMLLCVPALAFLHRRHLILDKEAGTVTQRNWLLLARWTRVVPYRGQSIRVERLRWSSSEGEAYWKGCVFLGKVPLFTMKAEHAALLARRIAAFLEIPYSMVTPRGKEARRLERRLWLVLGPSVLVSAAWFLWVHVLR